MFKGMALKVLTNKETLEAVLQKNDTAVKKYVDAVFSVKNGAERYREITDAGLIMLPTWVIFGDYEDKTAKRYDDEFLDYVQRCEYKERHKLLEKYPVPSFGYDRYNSYKK